MTSRNPHIEQIKRDVDAIMGNSKDEQLKMEIFHRFLSDYYFETTGQKFYNEIEKPLIKRDGTLYSFANNARKDMIWIDCNTIYMDFETANGRVGTIKYTDAIIGKPHRFRKPSAPGWENIAGIYTSNKTQRTIIEYLPKL